MHLSTYKKARNEHLEVRLLCRRSSEDAGIIRKISIHPALWGDLIYLYILCCFESLIIALPSGNHFNSQLLINSLDRNEA